jgi:hypothetical protein
MTYLTKSLFFAAALTISGVSLADGSQSHPPRVVLADGSQSHPPRVVLADGSQSHPPRFA